MDILLVLCGCSLFLSSNMISHTRTSIRSDGTSTSTTYCIVYTSTRTAGIEGNLSSSISVEERELSRGHDSGFGVWVRRKAGQKRPAGPFCLAACYHSRLEEDGFHHGFRRPHLRPGDGRVGSSSQRGYVRSPAWSIPGKFQHTNQTLCVLRVVGQWRCGKAPEPFPTGTQLDANGAAPRAERRDALSGWSA